MKIKRFIKSTLINLKFFNSNFKGSSFLMQHSEPEKTVQIHVQTQQHEPEIKQIPENSPDE